MKKLLLILGGLIVLIVAVVVVTPFLIPVETYKNQVQKQVSAATGRDLEIAGDVGFSLLPSTRLTVRDVAFGNASWASEPYMARLDSLQVKVDPWSLLSGELKVQSFVLRNPVIRLTVNEDGTPNWRIGEAGAPAADGDGQAAGDGGTGTGRGTGAPLKDITLEDVRIEGGQIVYDDLATGATYTLNTVNLSLDLKTLDAPFGADGALTYNGEEIEVALNTGPPRALMAGEPTDVSVELTSAPLDLNFDGQVTNAEPTQASGAVSLDIPSLKRVAAWIGEPIDAAEGTLETLKLSGQVSAAGPRYGFTADSLQFDKIEGQGELTADLSGEVPKVTGELKLARLDVTPYMPAPTEPADGEAAADDGGDAAPAEWSDTPIDLSPMQRANVDFDLSVESIKAREIEVGRSALNVRLQGGELVADLTELSLYDGSGVGRILVDSRPDVPKVGMSFDLKGVSARPLLTDAAGFERLEGSGDLAFDVAAQGRSQKAIVEDLDGKGALRFTDGAIVGINLAQMVRNVGNAFTGGGNETQKTDFAELAGTFTITDGLLRNDDLLMLNPLLRLRGEGTADIPARTVDYRVTPKAVASLEGQGGDVQAKGVAVPVIIKGPWHDISYRPDLESVLRDAIRDPAKMQDQAKETIETLRESGGQLQRNLGDTLQGLTGGALPGASDAAGGADADGGTDAGSGTGGDGADTATTDGTAASEADASEPASDGGQLDDAKQQLQDAGDQIRGLFD